MPKLTLESAFSKDIDDVCDDLQVDPEQGLDGAEVTRRRRAYGPNRLRSKKKKSILTILIHQFNSIIVWLLAIAAVFSFLFRDVAEGIAIVLVLLINGAIGFFTELRAARSMEALLRIAEVRTRVRRAGKVQEVDARDLVPGDIVILEAGDVVTADLRLTEASNLQSDESVLTGESTPVAKTTDKTDADAELGDRTSMVFKGTAITQGAGEAVVAATGMETELGQISDLAQSASAEVAPLEKRLDGLGHRLVWLTLALAGLTIAAGILRGNDVATMIQTGIALAVAAVPEGLPVVATLSLARGMKRMADRNALITQLSSVETLGATTVILTDKTGTLTENRMTAVRYLLSGLDVDVVANGDKFGFAAKDEVLDPGKDERLAWALKIGALCNNAELGDGSPNAKSGDPMETALLSVAEKAGLGREMLLEDCEEVREHSFDPETNMMATVHADGKQFLYAVKGAPEAVIAACDTEFTEDGQRDLDDNSRKEWTDRNSEAAQEGLRLLALAMKTAESKDEDPYEGLSLIGFVCLLDPLRDGVSQAVQACRDAGVRVVMLTGDHAETAATIAANAGIGGGELSVIKGSELTNMDGGTASDKVLSADVFARVAPKTKLDLVSLFQEAGHVVAMTGDGVNDAPALKKSDIGIAMGQRGTQVAREAADMVLKDDAFETIIVAMRQGRTIFDNIRKFVVYLMSCNVSEVLVVGLAVGIGLPTPLLPLQILFLNLVTDVFPAFALGLGQGDEGVMKRPPRDPEEAIVDRPRWLLIGLLGVAITLATLGAFALSLLWLKLDADSAVTVAFLTLSLAQLWNVFNMRAPDSSLFRNEVTRNTYIWAALAFCLVLIALALWLPGLSNLLRLPHPGLAGLSLAAAMSFLPLFLGQVILLTGRLNWLALDRSRFRQ